MSTEYTKCPSCGIACAANSRHIELCTGLPLATEAQLQGVDFTDNLLAERGKTHGSFESNAYVAQNLKAVIRSAEGHKMLSFQQLEALDFICSKIGRIMSGQPGFQDHWDDIAGYAKLVSQDLQRG